MSEKQQLSQNDGYCSVPTTIHGHDENGRWCVLNVLSPFVDEECDIPTPGYFENDEESDINYARLRRKEKPKFTNSSEINKKLLKPKTWKLKTHTSTKPSLQVASLNASGSGIIGMVDTIDRPAKATAKGTYAGSGAYAEGLENKPGKRIPKAGAYAEAGVGRARAEFSIFEVEARGPNASASAEATVARLGAGAMAQAEVASASAIAGPVGVKLGLGFDTGGYIGLGGVEAKILGIGFSIGPKTSISFLNSELSFSFL